MGDVMYSREKNKSVFLLILLMAAGIVVGGFIGKYIGQLPYMDWIKYSKTFGITEPFVLDLDIIKIQLGLSVKFSIAGIICMAIAGILYIKL